MGEVESIKEQEELLKALAAAIRQGKDRASAFIHEWYIQQGRRYFFIFRKNLSVTNIQHRELLSLIEVHAERGDKRVSELRFASLVDYTQTIDNLMGDFFDEDTNEHHLFVSLYGNLLRNTIIVQPLYGTCAIYLPPNIDINLLKVVGESGYIHFAGRCAYICEAKLANKASFFRAIKTYMARYCEGETKVAFLAYSHEDGMTATHSDAINCGSVMAFMT